MPQLVLVHKHPPAKENHSRKIVKINNIIIYILT